SKEKPVGTVWIAAAYKNRTLTQKQEGDNGREENISQATKNALSLLHKLLSKG
ncbi:CinA family protein, partial [Bacteroides sp.]